MTNDDINKMMEGILPNRVPSPSGIHTAIAAVYEKVGYVQKTGEMKGFAKEGQRAPVQYKFAGEADFIEAIRPALVENGIYLHVNRVREVVHEVFVNKSGSPQNRVTLIATVRFTHKDGSYIESEATGEGMDSGDKASNKAMTGALKYALRQTFCIETGTDPDDTPSSEQQRDTPRRENTPPAQPQRTQEQPARSAPATGDAWAQLTALMRDAKVGKSWVEPIMGGFSAASLDAWLAAEEGRTPNELVALAAKGKGN